MRCHRPLLIVLACVAVLSIGPLTVPAVAKGPAAGGGAKACQGAGWTDWSTSTGGAPFSSEQACSAWVTAGNALAFSPVTVTPMDLRLGAFAQRSVAPAQTFTFRNGGTRTLSITALEYWDATLGSGATCLWGVTMLVPGASCTSVIVPRTDLTVGPKEAFTRLFYNAGRKLSGWARGTYGFTLT